MNRVGLSLESLEYKEEIRYGKLFCFKVAR